MIDLEGNALVVGAIYIVPDSYSSRTVVAKFSHETQANYIFKPVKYVIVGRNGNGFYSWKRQMAKDIRFDALSVIRVSQSMIDRYILV